MNHEHIQWKFNLSSSTWVENFMEVMVKLTRRGLKVIVKDILLM